MKIIKLNNNKETIVDDDVYELVKNLNWKVSSLGYVYNRKYVYLSRFLLGVENNKDSRIFVVDHINRDVLDNRKSNLRICTVSQNGANRKVSCNNRYSGMKGVSFKKDRKRSKPWVARIVNNYKSINLGYFLSKEEASEAYKRAAKEIYGCYCLESSELEDKSESEVCFNTKNGFTFKIDMEDLVRVKELNWYFQKRGVWTQKTVLLHRLVLGLGSLDSNKILVDHINSNTLDNRRLNLRTATYQQNFFNSKKISGCSSKYKGVVKLIEYSKTIWRVRATLDGIVYSLGRYSNEIEAAKAYDVFAKEKYGEFAKLNFPQ